jgi:hypothetical protein
MDQLSRAEQLEQKRSYWKQQIEQWQQTGLSQAEYCRRNNSEASPTGLLEKALFKNTNRRILRSCPISGSAGYPHTTRSALINCGNR